MNNPDRSYESLSTSGTYVKRACLRELRQSMTVPERILWSRLRGNRLRDLHFRRQVILHGFIVDFYCHKARLIIELDGPIHAQQAVYDAERDAILKANGYIVLRVPNDAILNSLGSVMIKILNVIGI